MSASTLNTTSNLWKQVRKTVANWTTVRRIMSVLLFLLAWTILVQFTGQFHQIPTPAAVFAALFQLKLGVIFTEIFRSFLRVLCGFLLGLLIGFPIGVAIGYSRIANYLLFPAVEMVRPIPPIAWIPLTVLFFINIESQIVFLTFYGAFFPIVYNTMGGISEVDIRLPRAAMSFGINRMGMLWKIILPAAMPQIFTGMKVAIGITWLMVVAAEMIASKGGLGYWVWYHHTVMEYPMVILGMGIIGLCGALCSVGIDVIGSHFMKWRNIF
ncbi:MAG: ABC transporter permease [Proteobacteria bacterium]|nr:ABC transporter permease [Pseudomonadota bacterium]